MRRIGIIQPASSDDAEYQVRFGALLQELQQLGWIIGRNIRIDTRWTKGDADDTRKYAAELVALAPDAIVATGISTVGPLLQLTRSVPIVFPAASDPVAAGLVESLARPGGNVTLGAYRCGKSRLNWQRVVTSQPAASLMSQALSRRCSPRADLWVPFNANSFETAVAPMQAKAGPGWIVSESCASVSVSLFFGQTFLGHAQPAPLGHGFSSIVC
jgi:hypothetical protein